MRQDDRGRIRVLPGDVVGPRQHRVARAELQRQHQPLSAAARNVEQVRAVVDAAGLERPLERRSAVEGRHRKVGVDHGGAVGRPAAAAVVMVPRREDIGHHAVEHVQAVVGVRPLPGHVVVHDIALVEHEGDVPGRVLGDDPGRLRVEQVRIVRRVVLRVRQDHDAVRRRGQRVGATVIRVAAVRPGVAAAAVGGAISVGPRGGVLPGERAAVGRDGFGRRLARGEREAREQRAGEAWGPAHPAELYQGRVGRFARTAPGERFLAPLSESGPASSSACRRPLLHGGRCAPTGYKRPRRRCRRRSRPPSTAAPAPRSACPRRPPG